MTLHIKLPKGKTSKAFERAAEQCSRRIQVHNVQFKRDLEAWRKSAESAPYGVQEDGPPQRPVAIEQLTEARDRLWSAADACKHSTGDVYLGYGEWNRIKGYY